ncbi:MAG: hypothetical protein RLZZ584_878 [Pseudomonadota bacterium]|jgi:two-component system phosphate regulon response regulator PhoB
MDGNILLIEDDASSRDVLTINLRHAGYQVSCARDLAEARTRANELRPDLVLMDSQAAGGQALRYTRQLRGDSRTADIAVIVIGNDDAREQDTVAALDCGADDCVHRSTSMCEMLARIRAVMRRSAPHCDDELMEIDGLRFDPGARRVSAQGQDIELGGTEYRMLRYLMSHPGRILSRTVLLDKVWGDHVCVEERAVDIHIGHLRRALVASGHDAMIETVRGMGYRFTHLPAEPAGTAPAVARPGSAIRPRPASSSSTSTSTSSNGQCA